MMAVSVAPVGFKASVPTIGTQGRETAMYLDESHIPLDSRNLWRTLSVTEAWLPGYSTSAGEHHRLYGR